ncbi:MAG TPA: response regulator [Anaerolineae bacterium]|nr:response regulator [Anaerolineae bacterium]
MTTVLIIEQDDATRELYQREVGRSFHVLSSSDAESALQLMQNNHIDAVVLEPAMADGAGWHLLEALPRMQPGAPAPVILCSVLDERKRGKSLGAAAYLVKPVLPAALLDTLDHILQG